MRRIKKLAAIMMLAAMVSLSAPATFAAPILMSDRSSTSTPTVTTDDLDSHDSTTQRTVEITILEFICGVGGGIIMTE